MRFLITFVIFSVDEEMEDEETDGKAKKTKKKKTIDAYRDIFHTRITKANLNKFQALKEELKVNLT